MTGSWANGDSINHVAAYYEKAAGASKEDRIYSALKSMFNDIEGVDGDIDNGGLKKFSEIFANDKGYDDAVRKNGTKIS